MSINNGDVLGVNDMDADGIVQFTGLTPSNDPTTGTLIVSGGVGIGLDLHVGGKTYSDKFLTTSDIQLKENIQPLGDALTKLKNIECYQYKYKNDDSKMNNFGVIA
jgi:hypothetical protein